MSDRRQLARGLLLTLVAVSHGPAVGLVTDVTTVQRLNTAGGNAPPSGCDATTIGAVARMPHTATHFMSRTNGRDNSKHPCNRSRSAVAG